MIPIGHDGTMDHSLQHDPDKKKDDAIENKLRPFIYLHA